MHVEDWDGLREECAALRMANTRLREENRRLRDLLGEGWDG